MVTHLQVLFRVTDHVFAQGDFLARKYFNNLLIKLNNGWSDKTFGLKISKR
jgi:hypothetical protein